MRSLSWSGGIRALTHALFGGTCYLCHGASAEGLLCAACAVDLPRLPVPQCPRCALPSPAGRVCGRCLAEPPAFDATRAAFSYAFPADILVQALKFRGELALAALLGDALAAALGAREPVDLVVPVPLHKARLRARGYNQSLEIARRVASRLRLPLAAHACERVRDTRAQLELPWQDRKRNVRGAFSGRIALDGRHIAVVDDVMTTGATLNELAATLKKFGAASVANWVVARTITD